MGGEIVIRQGQVLTFEKQEFRSICKALGAELIHNARVDFNGEFDRDYCNRKYNRGRRSS